MHTNLVNVSSTEICEKESITLTTIKKNKKKKEQEILLFKKDDYRGRRCGAVDGTASWDAQEKTF